MCLCGGVTCVFVCIVCSLYIELLQALKKISIIKVSQAIWPFLSLARSLSFSLSLSERC